MYRGIAELTAIGVGVHNPPVERRLQRRADRGARAPDRPERPAQPRQAQPRLLGRSQGSDHLVSRLLAELSGPAARRSPHREIHRRAAHGRDRAPRTAPAPGDGCHRGRGLGHGRRRASRRHGAGRLAAADPLDHEVGRALLGAGHAVLTPETMMQTIVDIGRSLLTTRARTLVFLNATAATSHCSTSRNRGAPPPLRSADLLHARRARALVRRHRRGPDEHGTGIHAGHGETSMIMHLAPRARGCVDLRRDRPRAHRRLPAHRFQRQAVTFGWLSNDFGPTGVLGDPTGANAAHGAELFEDSVSFVVEALEESQDSTTPRERAARACTTPAGRRVPRAAGGGGGESPELCPADTPATPHRTTPAQPGLRRPDTRHPPIPPELCPARGHRMTAAAEATGSGRTGRCCGCPARGRSSRPNPGPFPRRRCRSA